MTTMAPPVPARSRVRAAAAVAGVVATLAVGGCGDGADDPGGTSSPATSATSPASSSPSSTTSVGPSTSTSSSPAGRTIEITVTGRTVDPAPSTVQLGVGETLTLRVTSDHHDELHIHGFEVEEELTAGVAQSVTVTGKDPGVYEVETHHPELRLLKIAVQ